MTGVQGMSRSDVPFVQVAAMTTADLPCHGQMQPKFRRNVSHHLRLCKEKHISIYATVFRDTNNASHIKLHVVLYNRGLPSTCVTPVMSGDKM